MHALVILQQARPVSQGGCQRAPAHTAGTPLPHTLRQPGQLGGLQPETESLQTSAPELPR